MAANPNPSRITNAVWAMWERANAALSNVQLGGIYARKPGYHGARSDNSSGDYSVQYAADRRGPADKAAALDITFGEAHGANYTRIKRYTANLFAGIRRNDSRLFKGGVPVIREAIGNVGGRARGLDAYTKVENARDNTHLWHIHISITRQFLNDTAALRGVIDVMLGEDELSAQDVIFKTYIPKIDKDSGSSHQMSLGSYVAWIHEYSKRLLSGQKASAAREAALAAAIEALAAGMGADPADIRAAAEEGARAALADIDIELSWSTDSGE